MGYSRKALVDKILLAIIRCILSGVGFGRVWGVETGEVILIEWLVASTVTLGVITLVLWWKMRADR